MHAALHWGQEEAAEILTEAGADFNTRNNIVSLPYFNFFCLHSLPHP